jgi:XRE family transcriptional regulator, aerobic/anaerobic benzoate catabolism transcriptional regulator
LKKVEPQGGWHENGHAGEDREYLRRLGNAVRLARSRRDMTRKGLAEQSGVSERFLAQLETGSGNASVLVLRKIAAALDIPIDALLAMGQQSQSPALMETVAFLKTLDGVSLHSAHNVLKEHFSTVSRERRRERIALIGLRGAGKSTLGAKLAERKTWPFVELDRRVEQASGVPLGTLFEMYGQEGFRRLEYRCLHDLLTTTKCFVLATGGSIVSDPGIYDLLLTNCFTVWLRATPEDHMQRVIAQGDLRPMAQRAEAMEDLKRILAERDELYRKADAIVETSGVHEKVALEQLTKIIEPSGDRVIG